METVSSRVEDGGESPEIRLNNGFKVAITNMFKEQKDTMCKQSMMTISIINIKNRYLKN